MYYRRNLYLYNGWLASRHIYLNTWTPINFIYVRRGHDYVVFSVYLKESSIEREIVELATETKLEIVSTSHGDKEREREKQLKKKVLKMLSLKRGRLSLSLVSLVRVLALQCHDPAQVLRIILMYISKAPTPGSPVLRRRTIKKEMFNKITKYNEYVNN